MSDEKQAGETPLDKVRFPVVIGGAMEGGIGLVVSVAHKRYDAAVARVQRHEHDGATYPFASTMRITMETHIGTIDEHVARYRRQLTYAAKQAFLPIRPAPEAQSNVCWDGVEAFQKYVDHAKFSGGQSIPYEEALNDAGKAECAAVRAVVESCKDDPRFVRTEVELLRLVFGPDKDLTAVARQIDAWAAAGYRMADPPPPAKEADGGTA